MWRTTAILQAEEEGEYSPWDVREGPVWGSQGPGAWGLVPQLWELLKSLLKLHIHNYSNVLDL